MEIQDKVVIVTGSGTGVGRASAIEFAKHGAKVVCAARRKEKIDETVQMIKDNGGDAIAVPTDITVRADVDNLVSKTLETYQQIDVLFNNAGRFNTIGAVWEVDPENWWQDVSVNIRGTMLCCHVVLQHMIKRDSGIIINMRGGNQIPGGTGYSCGKVGVIRFTELLAKELVHEKSSVIACILGPGFVRSEMTEVQITTELGRKWIPSSAEAIENGEDSPPERCAESAVRLVQAACPELNGGNFSPGTDYQAKIEAVRAKESN